MSYDKSKDTTKEDVRREAGEAVAAVRALAHGGKAADAAKEVGEAVVAAEDFVVDASKRLWVKVKKRVGTVFHNPHDDVVVTQEATQVSANQWVKDQLNAGLIEVTEAPAQKAE